MTGRTLVFDPVAPFPQPAQRGRQALAGLRGKVVGFIDNAKPNFNHLVNDLAQLLMDKHGVAAVIKRRKRGPMGAASDRMVEELVAQCDAVIAGAGD